MLSPSCHERSKSLSRTMITVSQSRVPASFQPSRWTFVVPLLFSELALAMPFHGSRQKREIESRDGDTTSSVQPQIWVPIIVVVTILLIGSATWLKRRRSLAALATRAPPTATTVNNAGARELTADQLAGRSSTTNPTSPSTPAARTPSQGRIRLPRVRRPRRTPSQISTTSLPVYMKEPGEQELVIFRGADDMEDAAPMTTTLVMPSVDENDVDGSFPSADIIQQAVTYPVVPHSPNDMPLLENDESNDNNSPQPITPAGRGDDIPVRPSYDANSEISSLMQTYPPTPDPRGEAPPYFEVVEAPPPGLSLPPTPSIPPSVPTIPEGLPHDSSTDPSPIIPQSEISSRRSGFRNLFHVLGSGGIRHATQHSTSTSGHVRGNSGPSIVSMSSDGSHRRDRAFSRTSHRPSHSGSGSVLNMSSSPFRTLSRQRSSNTLASAQFNSPSVISLNSISSPLTHTLVRTDITYPKSGPTPEQMKLISSRETFAKFGVPYGADAIAYAASASRQELFPPPGFEESQPGTSTSELAPGSSHSRRPSNATPQVGEEETVGSPNTSATTDANASDSTPESSSGSGLSPQTNGSTPSSTSSVEVPAPVDPATAPAVEPVPTALDERAPAHAPPSLTLTIPQSLLSPSAPSSFRQPSTAGARSESRASSVASFATAAESIVAQSTPSLDDSTITGDQAEHTPPQVQTEEDTDLTISLDKPSLPPAPSTSS